MSKTPEEIKKYINPKYHYLTLEPGIERAKKTIEAFYRDYDKITGFFRPKIILAILGLIYLSLTGENIRVVPKPRSE